MYTKDGQNCIAYFQEFDKIEDLVKNQKNSKNCFPKNISRKLQEAPFFVQNGFDYLKTCPTWSIKACLSSYVVLWGALGVLWSLYEKKEKMRRKNA